MEELKLLRKEKIKIGDREIEVTEISFAGQMRMESIEGGIKTSDMLKESVSEENFKLFDELSKQEGKLIIGAMDRVNGWDKKRAEKGDKGFPSSSKETENGTSNSG